MIMKNDTDVTCNWILEENLTEISGNKDEKLDVLNNLDNEISIKAKELDKFDVQFANDDFFEKEPGTISENKIKKEIDLHNLPLYFPQELSAKGISASLNHTQNTQRWIGYVISKTDKKFTAKPILIFENIEENCSTKNVSASSRELPKLYTPLATA